MLSGVRREWTRYDEAIVVSQKIQLIDQDYFVAWLDIRQNEHIVLFYGEMCAETLFLCGLPETVYTVEGRQIDLSDIVLDCVFDDTDVSCYTIVRINTVAFYNIDRILHCWQA